MIAKELDITIEQGATFDATFTWNNDAGSPINLTNYTGEMMLRTEGKDGVLVFTFKSTPGINDGSVILGGSAGTIRLLASFDKTALLAAGRYAYDLELTDTAPTPDVVYRLMEGFITITREATRV
jgi:hypothetical protein